MKFNIVLLGLLSLIGIARGGSEWMADWEKTGSFPDVPLVFFSIACDQENNVYVGAEFVVLDKKRGIYTGALDTGRVFKSTDEGRHWELTGEIPDYAALDVMSLLITKDGTIYCGTDDRDGRGRVYKSTNGGNAWKSTGDLPGAEPSVYCLIEGEDGTIYAGSSVTTAAMSYSAVYKSTNKGQTWSRIGTGQIGGRNVMTLLELPDGTLFAGGIWGTGLIDTTAWLYKSTDKGGTWERVDIYPEGELRVIYKLVYANEILYAATACVDSIGGTAIIAPRVFKSISYGSSWISLNPIPPDAGESVRALLKSKKGILYAGTQGHATGKRRAWIFKSSDDLNWKESGSFELADGVYDIVQAPNDVIYAAIVGSTASVYKNLTEKESVIEEKEQILYATLKASSNLFNQNVVLTYELPTPTRVSLKVYNTSGRLVKSLFSGKKSVGVYHIAWNTMELPSGIYFLRLKTSKQSLNRKVVVMK